MRFPVLPVVGSFWWFSLTTIPKYLNSLTLLIFIHPQWTLLSSNLVPQFVLNTFGIFPLPQCFVLQCDSRSALLPVVPHNWHHGTSPCWGMKIVCSMWAKLKCVRTWFPLDPAPIALHLFSIQLRLTHPLPTAMTIIMGDMPYISPMNTRRES